MQRGRGGQGVLTDDVGVEPDEHEEEHFREHPGGQYQHDGLLLREVVQVVHLQQHPKLSQTRHHNNSEFSERNNNIKHRKSG